MRPMFLALTISSLVPLVAACVQTAAPPPVAQAAATVQAAPAATSAPLTPGNMPAYCRGEASAVFGVRPVYIKTAGMKTAANGGYTIDGTADQGQAGKKPFQCRFTAKREFIDVMSLTNEGAL